MTLGVDGANYTAIPTDSQCRELMDLGFSFAIIGTSWGTASGEQILAFNRNGFDVSEYQFPNALRATTRPWWCDAELPSANATNIRNALRLGAQGPYTRRSWWNDNLPDFNVKAEFPDAKLWDARFVHPEELADGKPYPCRIAFAVENGGDVAQAIASELLWLPPFTPYAGFTEAAITQWHGSVTVAGLNLDLDVIEHPVQEDEDMKPFLVFEAGTPTQWLIGFAKPILIGSQAEADSLAAKFGAPTVALSSQTIQQMTCP